MIQFDIGAFIGGGRVLAKFENLLDRSELIPPDDAPRSVRTSRINCPRNSNPASTSPA
jgi:hypothetical protein